MKIIFDNGDEVSLDEKQQAILARMLNSFAGVAYNVITMDTEGVVSESLYSASLVVSYPEEMKLIGTQIGKRMYDECLERGL